jgi:four helix bundle protein
LPEIANSLSSKESMNETEFKRRTMDVALRIVKLVETLPATRSSEVLGKQLLRSGTSVGANYRAACRAKSSADLIHKLSIVEEEADESLYWLELLVHCGAISEKKISKLYADINEITAMTVSSIKTLRAKRSEEQESKIQNRKSKI